LTSRTQKRPLLSGAEIASSLPIAAGCMGLVYGGFSYTKESTAVKLGPIELKVQEKETVSVPLIVSAGAIAVGVFVLVGVGRK
jgi:hypothetical protein